MKAKADRKVQETENLLKVSTLTVLMYGFFSSDTLRNDKPQDRL